MCLYQKFYHFYTAFQANYFFCLPDHAYTHDFIKFHLKDNINPTERGHGPLT
jgi:hypothetical protein